ncbi:flagellar hook-length control protein FliK [Sulfurimonas aquatica]|uniref:Flagellar hook-length control protein FliK n=1 Tax=Sulfurimonas aquatica TaxID=2672570 RepID=A0A975AY03_9BACT|nr:flagellar hook-length control protein FliK [Sulfurimonas aquatica]QSZ40618.1 flagellar hook-length control protein FliK [Sulfurimonas aquatica]
MISLDVKTKPSSPLSLGVPTLDAKENSLSFSELLKGISLKDDDKAIQAGPVFLAFEDAKESTQATQEKPTLGTLLSLLKGDGTIAEEIKSMPQKSIEASKKDTLDIPLKELKILVGDAKEYLKTKILESSDFKKFEAKELPKTLKGLVSLAEKFGLDLSKITLEEIKQTPSKLATESLVLKDTKAPAITLPKSKLDVTKLDIKDEPIVLKKETPLESFLKEKNKAEAPVKQEAKAEAKVQTPTLQEAPVKQEAKAEVKVQTPTLQEAPVKQEAKAEAKVQTPTLQKAPVKQEAKAEVKVQTPTLQEAPVKQETKAEVKVQIPTPKEAPVKQELKEQIKVQTPIQQATKHELHSQVVAPKLTTQEIVTNRQPKVEEKSAKSRADETLKLLLRGEKSSLSINANITADFSVATAKVIAPSATTELSKNLASLLSSDTSNSESSSKVDGLNIPKADSFEVKLQESKQMIKYLSSDVKSAIEDYKSPFTRIKIQLNPQRLGEIDLTVVQRGKNLHVNLSSNNAAINTLALNVNDLRTQLNNSGINNASLNFNNNSQSSESGFSGSQQQSSGQQSQARDEYRSFQKLDEEETSQEILSSLEIVVPRYI